MRERNRSGLVHVPTAGGGAWRQRSAVAVLLAGAAASLAYWAHDLADPVPATATAIAPVVARANHDPVPAVHPAVGLPITTVAPTATPDAPPTLAAPAQPAPAELPQALRDIELGLRDGAAPADTLRAAHELLLCAMLLRHSDTFAALEATPAPENKSMAEMREKVRHCQSLEPAQLARVGEAFLRAYEGSAPGAASAYLRWLTLDQPVQVDSQLLDKLRDEVRQGVWSGSLISLAGWGYGSDDIALQQGFSLVEARAYREAWFQVVDIGVPGNSASGRELVANMGLLAGPPLPAAQQLEVEALVRQIVEAARAGRSPGS